MARSNDLDIRATADQISALFNANRQAEALRMLDVRRQGQAEIVRDALDRYVGAASAGAIANQQQGPVVAADASVLQRLQLAASNQPASPPQAQMAALSDAQRYDVYASIVQVRGNEAAHEALSRPNERVVLGLRQENSTLAAMQDRAHAGSLRSDDPATLPSTKLRAARASTTTAWSYCGRMPMERVIRRSPNKQTPSRLRSTIIMQATRGGARVRKAAWRTGHLHRRQALKASPGPGRSKARMSMPMASGISGA